MDDAKLVAAVLDQEPEAAQELLSCYGDQLLGSAFLLCGNQTEAQDLAQETFLTAFRSLRRFRGQSTLYSWLHGILLNLTRHYYRDSKRLVYDEELLRQQAIPTETNPSRLDLESASNQLTAALQTLSPPQREVVVLRFFEDMKIQEIAAHLSVSRGTVKPRLHYALRELEKRLSPNMNLFGVPGTDQVVNK